MTTFTRDQAHKTANSWPLNQRIFSVKVNLDDKISSLSDPSGFNILSLTDTKKGKVSDFTDYPFTSNIDISSCLSVETMDTPTLNMDSLDFYFEDGRLKNKSKPSPDIHDANLFDLALADLDPEVEQSFDIQELIEKSHEENTTHALFPELGATLAGTPSAQHAGPAEGTSLTAVKGEREDGQMPHRIVKVELPFTSTAESANVLTISPEDLASITNALDGPVILDIANPVDAEEAPEEFELQPESPYSCVSEATSTTVDYSTVTPQRRGPKPKSVLKSVNQPAKSRRRVPPKDTDEYKERRARNNVAVRKSRDKAKVKHLETETKVKELTDENQRLQKKCDLLTKELSVLKGLFTNVGASLPAELSKYFGKK